MNFKRFFYLFLAMEFLGLSIVAGVCYTVDPANIFHSDSYIEGVGNILLQGKNVANVTNYDERLLQKYLIENRKNSVDVLVLGSSRSMMISKDLFPGKSFINHSVSGATLEDDVALLFALKEQQNLPKIVVLGLDPWLFNKYNGLNRWKSLENEYRKALRILGLDNSMVRNIIFEWGYKVEKYKQLIALAYLKESLRCMRTDKVEREKNYFVTSEVKLPEMILFPDGTRCYAENFRELEQEKIDKKAIAYVAKTVYALEKYDELDSDLIELFNKIVNYLIDNNVEVVFWLPPYHPIAYDGIQNKVEYKSVLWAEQYFRDFAKVKNIRIVGAYNPAVCGLSNKDFYDGMHMRRECVYEYLKGKIR